MKKAVKVVLVLGSIVLGVAALRTALIGYAYSVPEVKVTDLGGRWEIETTRWLAGGNPHSALFRRNPAGREKIAEIVYHHVYFGDDCVLYGAPMETGGPQCRVACGAGTPQVVVAESCWYWQVEGKTFQVFDSNQADRKVTVTLDLDEVKARTQGS